MARLPIVDSDDGTWGTILNDFLSVAHDTDGTILNIGVVALKATDSLVVHKAGSETISGDKNFSGGLTHNGNALYEAGGTDVAVADGGTGASSAAGARTNLGLGNVDNTSDANKPVSTATQAAIDDVSSTTILPHVIPNGPQSTLITGFQTGHGFFLSDGGAGGTLTDPDTSSYINGDHCVKVTTGGTGANTYLKHNSISPTIDMTGMMVRIWMRLPRVADGSVPNDEYNLNSLVLQLSSDNVVSNHYFKQIMGPVTSPGHAQWSLQPDGWVATTIGWGEFAVTGSPNRAAINAIWLRAIDRNGQSVQLQYGGIELVPEPSHGVVSFSFDDGRLTQFTKARKKMSDYRYPGTAYIITDIIDDGAFVPATMTTAQLRSLQDEHGWEIASHSLTIAAHNQTNGFVSMSANQVEAEFIGVKQWLSERGFHAGDHLALPHGQYNAAIYPLMAKYFHSTRTTFSNHQETWPPSDRNTLTTVVLDGTTTFAAVQALITAARLNNTWLLITAHDVVDTVVNSSTEISTTIFNQIVDEVHSQGVVVRTVGDVIENGIPSFSKTDIGLGNVNNTSDANKPVSTATQTALDLKAPLASPALTGSPTAPTQTQGDSSTKLATTAFVQTEAASIDGWYKTIRSTAGKFDALSTSNNRLMTENGAVTPATANAALAAFHIDPADYTLNGRTAKMRLVLTTMVNSTAPAFSAGLFAATLVPITAPTGAAATITVTAGTAVAGSSVSYASPAANSLTQATSSDFDVPSAGFYALNIAHGNMAANSSVLIRLALQARHI